MLKGTIAALTIKIKLIRNDLSLLFRAESLISLKNSPEFLQAKKTTRPMAQVFSINITVSIFLQSA
jgi:hypothetical protein